MGMNIVEVGVAVVGVVETRRHPVSSHSQCAGILRSWRTTARGLYCWQQKMRIYMSKIVD